MLRLFDGLLFLSFALLPIFFIPTVDDVVKGGIRDGIKKGLSLRGGGIVFPWIFNSLRIESIGIPSEMFNY